MEELILDCAVVDDSSLQRLAIVKMIKDHPNLRLAAQYNNAIETKNGLLETKVDLIFLDISSLPIAVVGQAEVPAGWINATIGYLNQTNENYKFKVIVEEGSNVVFQDGE